MKNVCLFTVAEGLAQVYFKNIPQIEMGYLFMSTNTLIVFPPCTAQHRPDYKCSNICVENSDLPHIELPICLRSTVWYHTDIDPKFKFIVLCQKFFPL